MGHEEHVAKCSVKLLGAKGKLLGSGFWVHPDGYGVTCYHVLTGGARQPPESLTIEFDERRLRARYEPSLSKPEHDIAVFKLLEGEATPVPFVRLGRAERPDMDVRVWGYREEFVKGYRLNGRIQPGQDLGRGPVYNLSSSMPAGSSVAGMSGGPVLDPDSGAVVGLLYAEEAKGPSVVYVHPIEKVFAGWPELPAKNSEEFRKSPWQQPLSEALTEHLAYQRWMFEEAPVLSRSPFALRHIYVDTECGSLTWGEVHNTGQQSAGRRSGGADEERPKNPFSERDGGRHDLLTTVMGLIGHQQLTEPIIVQGIAGSGKSSFTLKLCVELQSLRLAPVLIRFKDLRLENLERFKEMLPQAVRLSDNTRSPGRLPTTPPDLFRGGEIFKEHGPGAYSHICRYVLILDGWDEISVANEGFKKRVERMLELLRNEYVDNLTLPLPLRIIITGRPTVEVYESGFLRSGTPLLTVRPFKPDHLENFVEGLARATAERPLSPPDADIWPPLDPDKVAPFLQRYRADFERMQQSGEDDIRDTDVQKSSLGVLGLPLLAQLTARLIAEWKHPPQQLIDNPTELYRSLVDLTCSKGGKAPAGATKDEIDKQERIYGLGLRQLLWGTAEAMTTYGSDVIPYETLRDRLKLSDKALDEKVTGATRKHSLTSLLISFYFKGGFKHTGCEFAHKSFREYLFAEALVEVLKDYGARALPSLPPRALYWQDFARDDPRYQLSRRLAQMLAPQWPRTETMFHVRNLIEWEIKRAAGSGTPTESETSTDSIDAEGWQNIRDGLADLWDWWGEGTHLRSQPDPQSYPKSKPAPAHIAEMINYGYGCMRRSERSGPPRTTTSDSHLGHGLFQLCVWTHYFAAAAGLGPQTNYPGRGRQYQSGPDGEGGRIRFAPSGEKSEYFMNYVHRIGAAGIRPNGWFPTGIDLRGLDLRGAHLRGIEFGRADLTEALLDHANLSNAEFGAASFKGCHFSNADLARAEFINVDLSAAHLVDADMPAAGLDNVNITDSDLTDVNLAEAVLRIVNIVNTKMADANMAEAKLNRVIFRGVNLTDANFAGARITGCKFIDTDISRIKLDGAVWTDVIFQNVTYSGDNPPQALRFLLEQSARASDAEQAEVKESGDE